MGRSFITGGLAGLLTSVAALALLSLAVPLPDRAGQAAVSAPAPEEAAAEAAAPVTEPDVAESGAETGEAVAAADPVVTMVEVPEGSEFAKTVGVAGAQDTESAPSTIAPQNGSPDPEAVPALTETETAAEPAADTAQAPTEMAPRVQAEAVVAPETEEPVSDATAAPGLIVAEAPEIPARVSGAGQAGGPPVPGQSLPETAASETAVASASEGSTGQTAAPENTADQPTGAAADLTAEPAVAPAADAPQEEAAADPEPPAPSAEPQQDTMAENAASEVAEPPAPAPEVTSGAPAEVSVPPTVAADSGGDAEAKGEAVEPAGSETADDVAGEPRIITLDPEPSVPGGDTAAPDNNAPSVKILRLPGTSEATEPLDETAPEAGPTSPLAAFAAPWANPDGKPVLGIVILDVAAGQGGAGAGLLSGLSFPVTVAVDPLRSDAADAALAYRSAGAEVALLVDSLPAGATPADLEVAYQSYVKTLPEAVALVGDPQASFLRSSTEAQHVSALLAADGRGLVTYQAGLNLARRAAERAGAPVVTIEKYFGPASADVLSRELDRAAFSATQSGTALIALPSTPEMLSALANWASGPSAAAVSLAPVSALMLPAEDVADTLAEEAPDPSPTAEENNLPGQKVGTFSDSN